MKQSLPILAPTHRTSTVRRYAVHLLRLSLVISLLVAVPRTTVPRDGLEPPSIEQLIKAGHQIPSGCNIGQRDLRSGLWVLEDSQSESIGWIARTFPDAQLAKGYRGPTEASIRLDADLKIISVGILSSEDTDEHVEAVKNDANFFQQFAGWDWTINPQLKNLDGVSGATLTSLALAEGMALRMGGEPPSLVFAKPIDLNDARLGFPEADSFISATGMVFNAKSEPIGSVVRTGVLSDHLIGYQGPTELLLFLDVEKKIKAIRIRTSFDNEPYVDYVRTEYGFWKLFRGLTLQQLSELDLVAEGVEGVSGATMTSQIVAKTLVDAAKEYQRKLLAAKSEPPRLKTRWRWQDQATLIFLLVGIILQVTRRFTTKRLRKWWLLSTIVLVGLCAGNLLSMSLIAGWAVEGISWRLAPGLTLIGVIAFLFPSLTKTNFYCSHVCPHGAVQQLVKPSKRSSVLKSIQRRIPISLTAIPALLLLGAYVLLQIRPSVDLSKWEPFHAYLLQVPSLWVIIFALGTLLISKFVPMAYCRYGCPTGFLLGYLRLNARSGYIRKVDLALFLLAIGTWVMKWVSI